MWHLHESVLNSIPNEEDRATLNGSLTDPFAPLLPPSERRCIKLAGFLEKAKTILDSGSSEWTLSEDPPIDDSERPHRLNALLAFYNHMLWIAEVFRDDPSISLSIR